jgi:nucleoside 2-deoxyribosyltransferase
MRIYLAGPDIFLADAAAIGQAKKDICARHGAEGIFPLDPHPDQHPDPGADPQPQDWLAMYLHNEAHIRAADALIANLTPFRGPSADAGTVYEIGLMRGLGRPVLGYANTTAGFTARTLAHLQGSARRRATGAWEDAEGLEVEEHGLHDNLMIDGGIAASGGTLQTHDTPPSRRWHDLTAFEACVRHLMRRG